MTSTDDKQAICQKAATLNEEGGTFTFVDVHQGTNNELSETFQCWDLGLIFSAKPEGELEKLGSSAKSVVKRKEHGFQTFIHSNTKFAEEPKMCR